MVHWSSVPAPHPHQCTFNENPITYDQGERIPNHWSCRQSNLSTVQQWIGSTPSLKARSISGHLIPIDQVFSWMLRKVVCCWPFGLDLFWNIDQMYWYNVKCWHRHFSFSVIWLFLPNSASTYNVSNIGLHGEEQNKFNQKIFPSGDWTQDLLIIMLRLY